MNFEEVIPQTSVQALTEDDVREIVTSMLTSTNTKVNIANITGTGQIKQGVDLVAGEPLAAGKPIFIGADGKAYVAHSFSSTITARYVGISTGLGSVGQGTAIQISGANMNLSGLTAGSLYYLQDPTVDQSDAGTGADRSIYGDQWCAQTFVPATTQATSVVYLKMRKNGTPTGDVTVSLRATAAGAPTGSDLVSTTVVATSLSASYADVLFVFTTPYVLTVGTTYAIVVRAAATDNLNPVEANSRGSSGYASGQIYTSTNGGSSWSSATDDLNFKTYYSGGSLGTTAGTVSKQVGFAVNATTLSLT